MTVKGYKAFNSDKTNRYGKKFKENEMYYISNDLNSKKNKQGFHICTSLCDVFRFFDNDIIVAEVLGFGDCVSFDDEYNGYYDMYIVSHLYIKKFLTREEIINNILNSSDIDAKKFLTTFTLNEEEKKLFMEKYANNLAMKKLILYYQYQYEDIYNVKQNIYQENKYKYLDILVKINAYYIKMDFGKNVRVKNYEEIIQLDYMLKNFFDYLKEEKNLYNIVEELLNICGIIWLLQPFYDKNTITLKYFIIMIINNLGYKINFEEIHNLKIPLFYDINDNCNEKDIQNVLTKIKIRD